MTFKKSLDVFSSTIFRKLFSLIWQIFNDIRQFFSVLNTQILIKIKAIWAHWMQPTMKVIPESFRLPSIDGMQ